MRRVGIRRLVQPDSADRLKVNPMNNRIVIVLLRDGALGGRQRFRPGQAARRARRAGLRPQSIFPVTGLPRFTKMPSSGEPVLNSGIMPVLRSMRPGAFGPCPMTLRA